MNEFMGLFKKHDGKIARAFQRIYEHGKESTESEFLDNLNLIIRAVETDDSYSTNEKLKIYELISQLSNCGPGERNKYALKLIRVLK